MAPLTILMATRNGADHLVEQLMSIKLQTHEDWRLWVSDDGSTDETMDILNWFSRDVRQEVTLFRGPERGATANFLSLVHRPDLPAGPVAFCDQDDVWYPQKLERALNTLQAVETPGPALYAGRADIGLQPDAVTGTTRLFARPPCFNNALIQTIGGGNTMVLSSEATSLLREAGPDCKPAFHDWWAYILVSGAGGTVLYDSKPMLFYRQHAGNLLGPNRSLSARRGRFVSILRGHYHHWVTRNLTALERCSGILDPENRSRLKTFRDLRRSRGLKALKLWTEIGLHRQNRLETSLMAAAAMAGRI
ncbi:MAG: glycosyltransferase family 2 protein, partial [Rhodobacteraceae bacterium]|nr:glycosyltransferase family 2 protein [Paracoccaceae bacterium]